MKKINQLAGCVKTLQSLTAKPIKSDQEAWQVIQHLAACFVFVAFQVDQLGLEVYGNGNPGGMKAELLVISKRVVALSKMTKELTPILRRMSLRQPKSSFDRFKVWLSDKVAPSVVTFIVMGILYLVFGPK